MGARGKSYYFGGKTVARTGRFSLLGNSPLIAASAKLNFGFSILPVEKGIEIGGM